MIKNLISLKQPKIPVLQMLFSYLYLFYGLHIIVHFVLSLQSLLKVFLLKVYPLVPGSESRSLGGISVYSVNPNSFRVSAVGLPSLSQPL